MTTTPDCRPPQFITDGGIESPASCKAERLGLAASEDCGPTLLLRATPSWTRLPTSISAKLPS